MDNCWLSSRISEVAVGLRKRNMCHNNKTVNSRAKRFLIGVFFNPVILVQVLLLQRRWKRRTTDEERKSECVFQSRGTWDCEKKRNATQKGQQDFFSIRYLPIFCVFPRMYTLEFSRLLAHFFQRHRRCWPLSKHPYRSPCRNIAMTWTKKVPKCYAIWEHPYE